MPKTIPCPAAHPRIGHIREYPPRGHKYRFPWNAFAKKELIYFKSFPGFEYSEKRGGGAEKLTLF